MENKIQGGYLTLFFGFLLIVLGFFVSLYGIGDYPIWNKDEGLYAESVREMYLNNNFFDPYFNYEHRWQKPILIYWVLSLSSYFFGVNEFGIRFGLWSLGVLTSSILYFLSFRLYKNHFISMFAVLFFVSSFAYVLQTRHIATHMLLCFTTLLSFTILWEMIKSGASFLKAALFGLSLGLGFLAKGPVGVVIVLVVAAMFGARFAFREPKQFFKMVGVGVLAFLIVALPWYLYMLYSYGSEYILFFKRELLDRVSTNITPNSSPFFYVGAFAGNFAPWSLVFYLSLILFGVVAFRHFKESLTRENLFVIGAFLIVMILFSLSASKLPAYVFIAQPFGAIFLAYFLSTRMDNIFIRWTLFFTKLLFVLAIVLLPILYFEKFWLLLSIPVALFVLFVFRRRFLVEKVALTALCGYFLIVANIYSEVDSLFPYKNIGQIAERFSTQKGEKFYEYGMFRESLPFYAKTKLERFDPTVPPKKPFLVITDKDNMKLFQNENYICKVLEVSNYYKGSDSDVFKMINILKGYKNADGKIGELVLLEVLPLEESAGESL